MLLLQNFLCELEKHTSLSLNQALPHPLTNTHSLTHSLQAHESLESILSSGPAQSPSPADLADRAGKRFSPPAPPLGFPGNPVGKESAYNAGDPSSIPGSGRSPGEGMDRLPTPMFLGLPAGSAGKESACNVGDLGLIPGLGRAPGEGNGYPLQYSGLENSMDCIVHRVAKSWT